MAKMPLILGYEFVVFYALLCITIGDQGIPNTSPHQQDQRVMSSKTLHYSSSAVSANLNCMRLPMFGALVLVYKAGYTAAHAPC